MMSLAGRPTRSGTPTAVLRFRLDTLVALLAER
jgi:hypothetical protein